MDVLLLEKLTRRLAKISIVNGLPCFVTDGDADLIAAFAALGWQEPHPVDLGE
jgi:hypothetical protein